MEKSLFSSQGEAFLEVLREARERRGMTQVELAAALDETQSFVSKCERGERRLDVLELRTWCSALDLTLSSFVRRLEKRLGA